MSVARHHVSGQRSAHPDPDPVSDEDEATCGHSARWQTALFKFESHRSLHTIAHFE